MKPQRRAVSLLVLVALSPIASVLAPASSAEAALIVIGSKLRQNPRNNNHYWGKVSGETNDELASVVLEIRSDAGEEELPLVETNAWLHGAATLGALPATDAALTLALYDESGAALLSFSGTLGVDGALTLSADASDTTDCASRAGCETSREATVDVELLAAELFRGIRDGYPDSASTLSFDLAGADTYNIASAVITLSETRGASGECASRTGCEETELVSTTAELQLDPVASIWEADATLDHQGQIEVRMDALNSRGHRIERADSKLGSPWLDEGVCVNTLSTDEDPLTSLALYTHYGTDRFAGGHVRTERMVIVSEDWTAGDAIPTHAQVELTGGETLVIPANSYQRVRQQPEPLYPEWDDLLSERRDLPYRTFLNLARNGSPEPMITVGTPVCGGGICAVVSESISGGYELAVSAFGDDADALPDEVTVEMFVVDETGEEVHAETFLLTLDDTVTAVFAAELSFAEDPFDFALSGQVQLLGEPNRRGRQDTLARGRFYGTLSRSSDGDLALAGADRSEVREGSDVAIGGAAVTLGTQPAVLRYGHGAGINGFAVATLSD